MRGFSLIELLVVLGIIAVIFAVSMPSFLNYRREQALDFAADEIVSALLTARTNSMGQEGDSSWGVIFQNSSRDYHSLFRLEGSNKVVTNTIYLRPGVRFYNLDDDGELEEEETKEISFEKIVGAAIPPQNSSVRISLKDDLSRLKTVSINSNGLITKQ